jgi:hypothetical protein
MAGVGAGSTCARKPEQQRDNPQPRVCSRRVSTTADQPNRLTAARPTNMSARIGARLGRPLSLAISVLALVGVVGTLSIVSSYGALCGLGRSEARATLRGHSMRLEASIGGALGTADALLARLAPHVRTVSSEQRLSLLPVLRELATARSGLTWLSASFTDGSFVGVLRSDSGELRGQESQLTPEGGVQRTFELGATGVARELERRPTTYDPRKREFYRVALTRGKRAWTAPYPFLPSMHTGISRVEPVYDGHQQLVAVITADFDASALAPLLGKDAASDEKRAVIAADGSVLATHGFALPAQASWPRDRSLRVSDVNDELLDRMVEARPRIAAEGAQVVRRPGASYYVDALPVADLDGAPIVLYSAREERTLYGKAKLEARRGLAITGIMALMAIGLAFVLSASIARLKEARESAEQTARKAEHEMAELGSYELLEVLGGGAMGEVYRARHKLLSREAALKLIHVAEDEDHVELSTLFFQEARRLASLRSIHTVAVYDFGLASDGRYFLAMELLYGLDLDRLVRRFGPQPPARVALILAQICDSLAEAHDLGLVHQDIKPANVFLCRLAEALDVVKVLDFGIARAVGPRGARLSRAEGTPGFMSPEQILGEPVGPLADLYGVGGIGHFLLAGRSPHTGSQGELVQSRTPKELTQLITRCLAKQPDHRPVSARVLAQALRDIARDHAHTFPDEQRALFWERFESEPPKGDTGAFAPSHVRTVVARGHQADGARVSRS